MINLSFLPPLTTPLNSDFRLNASAQDDGGQVITVDIIPSTPMAYANEAKMTVQAASFVQVLLKKIIVHSQVHQKLQLHQEILREGAS